MIDYQQNLSDHHAQTASLTIGKTNCNVMTWNVTKQCDTFGSSGFNNGFGKIESNTQYSARVAQIGTQVNNAIKNDPDLGITFLQEVPDKDSDKDNYKTLVDNIKVGLPKDKWKDSCGGKAGQSVLTMYDNDKYDEVAIPSVDLDKITKNTVHGIHPLLLKDKKTGELVLAVNIHAKTHNDPDFQNQMKELDQLAARYKAKLVVGGDCNRDIKDKNQQCQNLTANHAGDGSYSYGDTKPKARDGFLTGNGVQVNNVTMNHNLNNRVTAHIQPSPAAKLSSSYSAIGNKLLHLAPASKKLTTTAAKSVVDVTSIPLNMALIEKILTKGGIPTFGTTNYTTVFDNLFENNGTPKLPVGSQQIDLVEAANLLIAQAAKQVLHDPKSPAFQQTAIAVSMVDNIKQNDSNHDKQAIKLQFSSPKEAKQFSDLLADEFGIHSHTFPGKNKTPQDNAIYLTKNDLAKLTQSKDIGLATKNQTANGAYNALVNAHTQSKLQSVSANQSVTPNPITLPMPKAMKV